MWNSSSWVAAFAAKNCTSSSTSRSQPSRKRRLKAEVSRPRIPRSSSVVKRLGRGVDARGPAGLHLAAHGAREMRLAVARRRGEVERAGAEATPAREGERRLASERVARPDDEGVEACRASALARDAFERRARSGARSRGAPHDRRARRAAQEARTTVASVRGGLGLAPTASATGSDSPASGRRGVALDRSRDSASATRSRWNALGARSSSPARPRGPAAGRIQASSAKAGSSLWSRRRTPSQIDGGWGIALRLNPADSGALGGDSPKPSHQKVRGVDQTRRARRNGEIRRARRHALHARATHAARSSATENRRLEVGSRRIFAGFAANPPAALARCARVSERAGGEDIESLDFQLFSTIFAISRSTSRGSMERFGAPARQPQAREMELEHALERLEARARVPAPGAGPASPRTGSASIWQSVFVKRLVVEGARRSAASSAGSRPARSRSSRSAVQHARARARERGLVLARAARPRRASSTSATRYSRAALGRGARAAMRKRCVPRSTRLKRPSARRSQASMKPGAADLEERRVCPPCSARCSGSTVAMPRVRSPARAASIICR